MAGAIRNDVADQIASRVLDRGTFSSVAALLRYYGRDRIRRFLCEGGVDRVEPPTVALWTAFLGIEPDECTPRSSPRRNARFWTA